jgi:hypothetical protein
VRIELSIYCAPLLQKYGICRNCDHYNKRKIAVFQVLVFGTPAMSGPYALNGLRKKKPSPKVLIFLALVFLEFFKLTSENSRPDN